MISLIHWLSVHEEVLAVLASVGVALLLVCCLECVTAPSRDKDDIFNRHAL